MPRTLLAALLAAFALLGCDSDDGTGDGTPQRQERTGEVRLGLEEGFVFDLEHAIPRDQCGTHSVDLITFAYSDTLKLEAGSPSGAMRVYRRGGRPGTIASFAEWPEEMSAPLEDDEHDILVDPEAGHAFVMSGNVTDGYARFRVIDGPGSGGPLEVTLEYQVVWYE